MIIPLYIADSGEFLSLENRLAFIMVRSGQDARYFLLTVTIKVNGKNFIPPPENYCRIYLAVPVSRNISTY